MSIETIDTLYMNVTFKNKKISIFFIYNSPNNSYSQTEKHLIPLIQKEYSLNKNIIVIGDFNIPYNSNSYFKICSQLLKYNLKQHIHKCSTTNNSTIDLLFTNLQIEKINILYAHWSDHNILQFQIM